MGSKKKVAFDYTTAGGSQPPPPLMILTRSAPLKQLETYLIYPKQRFFCEHEKGERSQDEGRVKNEVARGGKRGMYRQQESRAGMQLCSHHCNP